MSRMDHENIMSESNEIIITPTKIKPKNDNFDSNYRFINPLIKETENIEQDSKLFNSNRNLNEESINIKITEKDISNNEILLKNEKDKDSKFLLNSNETTKRRENFMYDNLSFKVRGFSQNMKSLFTLDDNLTRRYTQYNIESGKNFFKMRYIKEKFDDMINLNKMEKMIEGKESLKSNDFKKNSSLNILLNEDKNAIKFNSLFLQKLEKSIFSFNLKKYEDSYNYLLGSQIIKDEKEFGELLLVIRGFDKYIVGDFLSREKIPNREKNVLKGFMNAIDFRSKKFLEAFRFLLSRLNLPKDSGLILEIIDSFSTVYYEDNRYSNNFKDVNSIYLLASTVLALNTMFSRSDIQNMKVFKKEDFVKMNQTVDRNVLENVYDELKENRMNIIYDYNEVVYKRLNLEQKDKEFFKSEEAFNKINNLNREPHPLNNNYKPSQSSESSFVMNEMKGEEIIKMLKDGEVFLKYGKYGDPHMRHVKLSDDEKKIIWITLSGCKLFKSSKSIEVSEIKDVYVGTTSSKVFEKYKITHDFDPCCFSVQTSKRTLDLRKNDENISRKWFQAFKFLIKRRKSLSELKNKNNLKDYINKKEIVSDIWKTEILPNWHLYRKALTYSDSGNNIFTMKKTKEKFLKLIYKKYNEKILDDKDNTEFLYLWTLGIPDWLRKKIWSLIIRNESGVTENLFNFHLKQVENINFDDLIQKINQRGNDNKKNPISNFNQISITNLQTNKLTSKLHVSDDPILNEIINDVIKISNKFHSEIKEEKSDLNVFMYDLFKVVRVFTLSRPDITYSKQISYISAILLLNSENFYSAFVNLVNISIPTHVMKFLTRDEIYIKIRLDFFEKLMKNYLPSVYKHFMKMDVTTSLYFFNWIENIFIKTFTYEFLLRIWDIYLLKGEVFLYEVGLCIMKIQEKDLTRFTVKDILKNLKKVSVNINEDEFFDMLQDIDISEDYKMLIYENNLAKEKGVLFQTFMIEWI